MNKLLIASYLFAIVAANLIVTKFGADALPFTAFILIPFDLIARDQLHEAWENNFLKTKMFALVFCGSLISWILNRDALNIAIASSCSFLISGFADYLIYHIMKKYHKAYKMICSNFGSSTLDSVLFQQIAFGQILTNIAVEQTVLKTVGSIIWTFIFLHFLKHWNKK